MGSKIINDIRERFDGWVELKRTSSRPRHSNWVSDLGHPCLRYLYYCRTEWNRKSAPTPRLQSIFLEGAEQELVVIRTLLGLGFKLMEQEAAYQIPDYNISGKIDGFISNHDQKVGFEIKSISPYLFDSVNSIDNLIQSRHYWHRNYYPQACLYMAMTRQSEWVFIFKNKNALEIKLIPCSFNIDIYNELLEKASTVNDAVKDKAPPERINDIKICDECDFNHICEPDIVYGSEGIEFLDDEELELKLRRYFEIKETIPEYEKIKEEVRNQFMGRRAYIAQKYKIFSSDEINVAANPSPKPRKGYSYRTVEIRKLETA